MNTAHKSAKKWLVGICLLLILGFVRQAGADDIHFDVLNFQTGVLSNVTVFSITKTEICVKHSGGLTSIKLKDLDADALYRLGIGPRPPEEAKAGASSYAVTADQSSAPDSGMRHPMTPAQLKALLVAKLAGVKVSQSLLLGIIGFCAALFLFASYCLKMIVEKTGVEPGFLVWMPILQLIPALRAAQMSPLWIVAFFIPLMNIAAYIVWAINIVRQRGKSGWVTVFLVLPITYIFAFLYLAFSRADNQDENNPSKKIVKLQPPPLQHAA